MPLLGAKRPPSVRTSGGMGGLCHHTSAYGLGSAQTYQLCDTASSQLPRASVSLSVKEEETPSGVAGRNENAQHTQRTAPSPRAPGCQHPAQGLAPQLAALLRPAGGWEAAGAASRARLRAAWGRPPC